MSVTHKVILGGIIAAALLAPASAKAATVLIDFGTTGSPTTTDALSRSWNNVVPLTDTAGNPYNLNASTGASSGIQMVIGNPPATTSQIGFNNANDNGTQGPAGTAAARGYPVTATRDSGFGNANAAFDQGTVQTVRLTLSGLDPSQTYNFYFFASRGSDNGGGTVSDNRETSYQVTGATTPAAALLNASNNTSSVASVLGVGPNGSNEIQIDITRGAANTNGTGFYYLNVLEIESVPEPASLGLLGIGATTVLLRRRRFRV